MVRVLGFDLGVHLALGLAVDKTLRQSNQPLQLTSAGLQQMLHAATIMRALTQAIPQAQRPEAGLSSLCGLLHNIGYLLLTHAFPQQLPLLCQHLAVNPHVHHVYLEQYLLGISREQIGAWLMRYWDMPEELASALRFQHDPEYTGPHATYPNLVCLSVSLLRNRGIGAGPQSEIPQSLFDNLGISREKAEEAVSKVLAAEVALRELAAQFHPAH